MKSKKELKEEYNQIKPKIGVYQILNLVNRKAFIDSSVNLDKIWNRHLAELKMGGHRNTRLQADWTEFGETNFRYEILSEIKQTDDQNTDYAREAKQLAKMFIEDAKSTGEGGYN